MKAAARTTVKRVEMTAPANPTNENSGEAAEITPASLIKPQGGWSGTLLEDAAVARDIPTEALDGESVELCLSRGRTPQCDRRSCGTRRDGADSQLTISAASSTNTTFSLYYTLYR
jgi:hypothetical protein